MIASINRKIIDPIADRYSCVFNPIKLKIKNNPKISEIKVKIHPLKEEERTIKINNEVYISKEDFNANIGKEVRLMNLYNIKIINEKEAEFLDDNQKNIPKINWVSEGINVKIMMPDAEMIEGFSEKAVEKLKVNDLIQFERFGFLRVDEIKKDKIVFWFSHK
jgi:glutamyl-tRNA synthetase